MRLEDTETDEVKAFVLNDLQSHFQATPDENTVAYILHLLEEDYSSLSELKDNLLTELKDFFQDAQVGCDTLLDFLSNLLPNQYNDLAYANPNNNTNTSHHNSTHHDQHQPHQGQSSPKSTGGAGTPRLTYMHSENLNEAELEYRKTYLNDEDDDDDDETDYRRERREESPSSDRFRLERSESGRSGRSRSSSAGRESQGSRITSHEASPGSEAGRVYDDDTHQRGGSHHGNNASRRNQGAGIRAGPLVDNRRGKSPMRKGDAEGKQGEFGKGPGGMHGAPMMGGYGYPQYMAGVPSRGMVPGYVMPGGKQFPGQMMIPRYGMPPGYEPGSFDPANREMFRRLPPGGDPFRHMHPGMARGIPRERMMEMMGRNPADLKQRGGEQVGGNSPMKESGEIREKSGREARGSNGSSSAGQEHPHPGHRLQGAETGENENPGQYRSGHGEGGARSHNTHTSASSSNHKKSALYVKNIPSSLNTIDSLNTEFKRFGDLIHLKIDLRRQGAHITFATHEQALKAKKSQDSIFGGNSRVMICWDTQDSGSGSPGRGSDNRKLPRSKQGQRMEISEESNNPRHRKLGHSTRPTTEKAAEHSGKHSSVAKTTMGQRQAALQSKMESIMNKKKAIKEAENSRKEKLSKGTQEIQKLLEELNKKRTELSDAEKTEIREKIKSIKASMSEENQMTAVKKQKTTGPTTVTPVGIKKHAGAAVSTAHKPKPHGSHSVSSGAPANTTQTIELFDLGTEMMNYSKLLAMLSQFGKIENMKFKDKSTAAVKFYSPNSANAAIKGLGDEIKVRYANQWWHQTQEYRGGEGTCLSELEH